MFCQARHAVARPKAVAIAFLSYLYQRFPGCFRDCQPKHTVDIIKKMEWRSQGGESAVTND